MSALLLVGAALAGDGPWTLPPGALNLYAGSSLYRFSDFTTPNGEGSLGDASITATQSVLVLSHGLRAGIEAELRVPYETARVNDPEAAMCIEDRPDDFCRPTSGVGDLYGQLKVRLTDELALAPLTTTVGVGVQSGEAYASSRDRLTTLGDGHTDLGVMLQTGRTGTLGDGWYRASASVGYWYRLPADATEPLLTGRTLGDDIRYGAAVLVSPHPVVGIGAVAHGFHRLWGTSIAEMDWADPNVFASLKARQLQVGPRVSVFTDGPTVDLSVLRTVYALNNPSNTRVVTIGLGWYRPGGS